MIQHIYITVQLSDVQEMNNNIIRIIFLLVQEKCNHFEIFFMNHKVTHITSSSPLIPSSTLAILLENAYIERSKINDIFKNNFQKQKGKLFTCLGVTQLNGHLCNKNSFQGQKFYQPGKIPCWNKQPHCSEQRPVKREQQITTTHSTSFGRRECFLTTCN